MEEDKDDLMDISESLYKIITEIMESDLYLEWATLEKKEPFKLKSFLEFLTSNPVYVESEENTEEENGNE